MDAEIDCNKEAVMAKGSPAKRFSPVGTSLSAGRSSAMRRGSRARTFAGDVARAVEAVCAASSHEDIDGAVANALKAFDTLSVGSIAVCPSAALPGAHTARVLLLPRLTRAACAVNGARVS